MTWLLYSGGEKVMGAATDGIERLARRHIGQRVNDVFDEMPRAIANLESQIACGVLNPANESELKSALIADFLGCSYSDELSWTCANGLKNADGKKVSLIRVKRAADSSLSIDEFGEGNEGLEVNSRTIPDNGSAVNWIKTNSPPLFNPAAFQAIFNDNRGHVTWNENDSGGSAAPSDPRNAGYSAARAVRDRASQVVSVVRVRATLSKLQTLLNGFVANDQRDNTNDLEVFVLDSAGRVIAQGNHHVSSESVSPQLKAMLEHVAAHSVSASSEPEIELVHENGQPYFFGLRTIAASPNWIFGVMAPQKMFLSDLDSLHLRVLATAALIMACIAGGGWFTLRTIRHGLHHVIDNAKRMQLFEFAPAPAGESIVIADVRAVWDSLEAGKMAIRAMQKYVPVTLLRQLYAEQKEAMLGAVPMDLSILFSDIRDFTAVSEKLSGPELARALGLYFEAVTGSINQHQGTIDKFIGDSVMAFWNAPFPIESDARLACLTALHSVRACEQLFNSPSWGDMPRWVTRYGIHRDRVMVGNFGAPYRMNYTAMGDGVNTASRLEGLNKVYGTSILVSEAIRDAVRGAPGARAEFVFRKLDVVAVKGKTKPTAVFELIGAASNMAMPECVQVYERAFDMYLSRDFPRVMDLLRPQIDSDPPSRVLFHRCAAFQEQPPPAGWNGVFIATTK